MELFTMVIFDPEHRIIFSEVPEKISNELRTHLKSPQKNFEIGWNNKTIYVERWRTQAQTVFKLFKESKAFTESEYYQLSQAAFEQGYDGVLLTDAQGYVVYLNQKYCDILGIQAKASIGKHVTEVIPTTRMHEVLRSKRAEIGVPWKLKDENLIISRIPLYKGSTLIGALGVILIRNTLELKELLAQNDALKRQVNYFQEHINPHSTARYGFEDIVFQSPGMTGLLEEAKKIAQTNSHVIIWGESGTGKELLAHALHKESSRSGKPFIRVNCGAIPKELFESELFGYAEGAFTGAVKGGKKGKFELAHQGTLFLDEIGELPLQMQVKLLRVIQEKELERVGDGRHIPIDVRIIAATNRHLKKMVDEGEFREDLYYRLNVFQLRLPALRERKEDVAPIVKNLLGILAKELDKPGLTLTADTLSVLENYQWPGNIRELRNVLERTVGIMDGNIIRPINLPGYLKNIPAVKSAEPAQTEIKELSYKDAIRNLERDLILKALELSRGKKTKAAEVLGIARSLLYKKMDELNIIEEHFFS